MSGGSSVFFGLEGAYVTNLSNGLIAADKD